MCTRDEVAGTRHNLNIKKKFFTPTKTNHLSREHEVV